MSLAVVALLIIVSGSVLPQDLGPEVAIPGKVGFGPFGWDPVDATTVYPVTPNPAALVPMGKLGFLGIRRANEVDLSAIKYSQCPAVFTSVYTGLKTDKHRSMWRVMRYSFLSDLSPAPVAIGQTALMGRYAGEAYLISYDRPAKHGRLRWGITASPVDWASTRLYNQGQEVAHGQASGFGGVVGLQWNVSRRLTVGGYWRGEYGKTRMTSIGTGARKGWYSAQATTIGLQYQLSEREKWSVMISYQFGSVDGTNYHDVVDLLNGGLQYTSGKWIFGISPTYYSATYMKGLDFNAGIGYSPETTSIADRRFGRGSAIYGWACWSF